MSILSGEFLLFCFGVLILYYLMPVKARRWVLTLASIAFVAFSGWMSLVHLTVVALVAWGGSWALVKMQKGRRLMLALTLILELGSMLLLKFEPSLAEWLNNFLLTDGAMMFEAWNMEMMPEMISVWDFALPIGLSYYTFQASGYLIDAYRGKVQVPLDPTRVWLFLGFFPQLSQGPIATWKELNPQLSEGHRLDPDIFVSGAQLMLWGYFKKMVIADRLAPTTDKLLEGGELSGWLILLCVALYGIRLYMDFSGGMNVVRGFSRMLGIELPLNFKRPFFAQSVADYWRRWHITLGAWFRTYVLYPLATSHAGIGLGHAAEKLFGKRAGRILPTALATIPVFLLIGVWHAVSWNAVIYGGYFGLLMAVSMLLDPVWKQMRKKLHLPKDGWMKPIRIIRTLLIVLLAQYFAFTTDADVSFSLLKGTFANWCFEDAAGQLTGIMTALEWLIALIGMVIVLVVDLLCEKKKDVCGGLARGSLLIRWPLMLLLLLTVLIFGVYGTGYDAQAFLYAQF